MKNIHIVPALMLLVFSTVALVSSCSDRKSSDGWTLVWEENFDGLEYDESVWTKIPRGTAHWNDQMSLNDACFEMRDGKLVLKGIVNPDVKTDTMPYITGGLYTKGKQSFHRGRIEVKAKMQDARGAWPAIWLMPSDTCQAWPYGGEIDIMERLNADSIAYQTVHSHYTYNLKIGDNPPQGSSGPIDPADFNVYALEMYQDSLVFFINDKRTFCYPRIETDKEGQFPFDQPYYLKIDMQLGGSWVGPVHMEDLPVEMEVDWVRFYQK